MGCGSGAVIWVVKWVDWDECAVWWLSVSDPESSSGLCSGSSSLEDSYGTLYVLLGLQDISWGGSVVTGGGGGGGKLCCNSSSSVHHPSPYLFCLGARSPSLVL